MQSEPIKGNTRLRISAQEDYKCNVKRPPLRQAAFLLTVLRQSSLFKQTGEGVVVIFLVAEDVLKELPCSSVVLFLCDVYYLLV